MTTVIKTPPPPVKEKSLSEQLDDVERQIADLQEKQKELKHEVAKEEARDDIEQAEKEREAAEDAAARAEEDAQEAWDFIREHGGHAATCLQGALAGSQALHPLCTCAWNHIATQLE